jgi:sugar (pentulose or hexulose) kinase
VPAAKVPPAVRAGDVLGELTAEAADHLRLDAAIPVVAGIVDAWASFTAPA